MISLFKKCKQKKCYNFFSITGTRQQFKRFCSRRCKERNCEQTSQQRRETTRKNARKRWHANPDLRFKNKEAKKIRYYKLTDEQKKAYNKERNDKYKAYRLVYHRNRMKTNTNYMVRHKISGRIRTALKEGYGEKSRTSCLEYIGCSIPQLRKHLESQFTDGMTWDNHGEWHIDHIKPCAAFDLSNEDEQLQCFHYSNVQPLWADDNLKKGATWYEN